MKISNASNYINQAYNSQTGNPASSQKPPVSQAPPAEEGTTDRIKLSERTRDLQKISQSMENVPADRKQLVENIKTQIDHNQYTVNAEKIAEKILQSTVHEIV